MNSPSYRINRVEVYLDGLGIGLVGELNVLAENEMAEADCAGIFAPHANRVGRIFGVLAVVIHLGMKKTVTVTIYWT